ncbi:uncharacterized protein [Miscanthus floridulus]|uniref:uncharacterized protein n=1 Tax=Miscanthus floridulus TaxID=154761 RepID=UPI00345AD0D6
MDLRGGEERGSLELPWLASTTGVTLDLGCGLGLAVPAAGVFARLTDISLTRGPFRGPCALGDAVSSPRCPCLLKLTVRGARGLDNLTIRSDSLREMTLDKVRGLERLAVASPALEYLSLLACFISDWVQPVADISAPALKVLRWGDLFDPSSVHLGTMKHLESVCPMILLVYGSPAIDNQDCLELLRCFKTIQCLCLTLAYMPNIDDNLYLMEEMAMLPDIMVLDVSIIANEHAFGASLFHVLRLCSGIKKLTLDLSSPSLLVIVIPLFYIIFIWISWFYKLKPDLLIV